MTDIGDVKAAERKADSKAAPVVWIDPEELAAVTKVEDFETEYVLNASDTSAQGILRQVVVKNSTFKPRQSFALKLLHLALGERITGSEVDPETMKAARLMADREIAFVEHCQDVLKRHAAKHRTLVPGTEAFAINDSLVRCYKVVDDPDSKIVGKAIVYHLYNGDLRELVERRLQTRKMFTVSLLCWRV